MIRTEFPILYGGQERFFHFHDENVTDGWMDVWMDVRLMSPRVACSFYPSGKFERCSLDSSVIGWGRPMEQSCLNSGL